MAKDTQEKGKSAEPVREKTPALETLLASGYPDIGTVENAKMIIEERSKNPALYPYEVLLRARAFLEAYNTGSKPVSTRPGWKRSKTR